MADERFCAGAVGRLAVVDRAAAGRLVGGAGGGCQDRRRRRPAPAIPGLRHRRDPDGHGRLGDRPPRLAEGAVVSGDVSKDLVFEEPRVPNRYAKEDAEDKTQPRGYWTVAEVEETMWRVRASGGTDSTPVKPE